MELSFWDTHGAFSKRHPFSSPFCFQPTHSFLYDIYNIFFPLTFYYLLILLLKVNYPLLQHTFQSFYLLPASGPYLRYNASKPSHSSPTANSPRVTITTCNRMSSPSTFHNLLPPSGHNDGIC